MLMADLWDLGEFDQKGTTATKWGSREDLRALEKAAQDKEVLLYFDAVLNHKANADETEKCRAIKVDWDGTFPVYLLDDRSYQDYWRRS
jgi:alpha-amylase